MSGRERFKRVREEEEDVVVSEGGKRFCGLTAEEEELLHLLEDAEVDCPVARNLDSEDAVTGVMRSLEEEIGVGANFPAEEEYSSTVGICGSEVESFPVDLGYLLEASDDELGIPPTIDNSVSDEDSCYHFWETPAIIDNSREDYGNLWQFEDQASSEYGLLEFGFDVDKFNEIEGERSFVNSGAASSCMLFEHGDVDQSWRREAAACGI